MTRLTSISERILTISASRSAGGIAAGTPYTSADFSSTATITINSSGVNAQGSATIVTTTFQAYTTWNINTASGTLSINTRSFPYHTFGQNGWIGYVDNTATHIQTWSYRAGTNTGTSSSIVPVGQIGYWLNGIHMYSAKSPRSPDGYSTLTNLTYNFSYQITQDFGAATTWRGDEAGGWPEPNNRYHYTDYSFENAWLYGSGSALGPNYPLGFFLSTATTSLIGYLGGSMYFPDGHSKLLGFAYDGYPVYGPKGYSSPLDSGSTVTYMGSGYEVYALPSQIAARVAAGATNTTIYPMGIFCEDYHYTANGDLDANNGRYCVTPDFPGGTYAYFMTCDSTTGKPIYPYILGATYKATPITTSTNSFVNGGGVIPTR